MEVSNIFYTNGHLLDGHISSVKNITKKIMIRNTKFSLYSKLKLFLILLITLNIFINPILLQAKVNKPAINKNNFDYSRFLQNINNIPLEQKIGQMLFIGFEGYTATPETIEYIEKYHVGGLILFNKGANPKRVPNIKSREQLKTLIYDLKKTSTLPLFIGIDNEGGKISRLKEADGFIEIPSHEDLGKEGAQATYNSSYKIGQELKELGINVNFAPVVDVNVNENCPIIGKLGRSFSSNPKVVAKLAKFYIKGQNDNGIITSIKHFPGHGSCTTDSHLGISDITETWNEKELYPYQDLVNNTNYNQMVMIGHLINSKLDPNYPTSLSKSVITGILRDQIHFKGVVITDSLDMKAITKEYTLKEVLITSINAGTDIVLNANNNPDNVFDPLLVKNSVEIISQAVKDGKIPMSRINDAYIKIITLKQQFNVN